jgi:hypothetical protein
MIGAIKLTLSSSQKVSGFTLNEAIETPSGLGNCA